MRHGSLFSGIGGFDLAAEWMGWENVMHCEWNEFGQKILKHYWPKATSYGDITNTDFTIHRGQIDILTGGFPCQPYSEAGKRLGTEDDRHLWPEMLRAIREIQPRFVVGENVSGLLSWNEGVVFNEVQTDLEAEGYEVQPVLLPACGVNAPHRRNRIWFVAYHSSDGRERTKEFEKINDRGIQKRMGEGYELNSQNGVGTVTDSNNARTNERLRDNGVEQEENKGRKGRKGQPQPKPWKSGGNGNDSNSNKQGLQGGKINGSTKEGGAERKKQPTGCIPPTWENFPTQSPICSGDDGLSYQLDFDAVWRGINPRKPFITFAKWRQESIKGYGNAIVPQVAYQIFKALMEVESKGREEKIVKQ
jgi:DNA (cytosine-5)-methyltransferase 1